MSVVENGYVPQMWENPQNYEEKNNGSYREEKVWANEAVFKLARAKLVREVDRQNLLVYRIDLRARRDRPWIEAKKEP